MSQPSREETDADTPKPIRALPIDQEPVARLDHHAFTYSIVVPVFNSADIVGRTVDRIVDVFEDAKLSYQIVLVNDGSRDGSWEVIAGRARANPKIVALNLLQNYG